MQDPGKVSYLTVDEEEGGQRLDNFLMRRLKSVPKALVCRIVRTGEVRVNRGRAQVTYRVLAGDQIRVPPIRMADAPPAQAPESVVASGAALPILYEDEALIVLDKPAGVAVHGGSGISFGVVEQLRAARPLAKFLELVHRLDRETSGVLFVAKKRSALVVLHDMLRTHQGFDKRYLALVSGVFPDARRTVRFKLFKYLTEEGERRVSVNPEGKEAHTVFYRREVFANASLLEAELKTGRTHQIRVHLAHSGFPILGDDKYGDFTLNRSLPRLGLKRMFLHAWRVSLPHPLSGVPLELEAPLPGELSRFLASLDASKP